MQNACYFLYSTVLNKILTYDMFTYRPQYKSRNVNIPLILNMCVVTGTVFICDDCSRVLCLS